MADPNHETRYAEKGVKYDLLGRPSSDQDVEWFEVERPCVNLNGAHKKPKPYNAPNI